MIQDITCTVCGFKYLGDPEDGADLCECPKCVERLKTKIKLKEFLEIYVTPPMDSFQECQDIYIENRETLEDGSVVCILENGQKFKITASEL